jgi:predicted permease
LLEIFVNLAPIFFYFALGVVLKKFGLADRTHGDFILRLVFFITLPLLILTTIPGTPLSAGKALLPLSNILVSLLALAAMFLLLKRLSLAQGTQGTLLIAAMTPNNTFMFPFILAVFGSNGFADAILFDFGNALLVSTFTYGFSFRFSDQASIRTGALRRVLKSPLVWALCLAVILSILGRPLPFYVQDIIRPLGSMTSPLILIALGIFFSLQLQHMKLLVLVLGMRMLLGLCLGWLVAGLLGLQGLSRVIVILCSAAPVGFSVLTFSSMAKLDLELASSAVSLSILFGLLWVPFLLLLMG